jgi:uncharacterized coiled-coil DUF342 family protein
VPAAVARHAEGEDRRRALARALLAGPSVRPKVTEKLEALRQQIAAFRAHADQLHAKLVELEHAGDGDEVRALRERLTTSIARIDEVVRGLEVPELAQRRARAKGTQAPDTVR